MASKSLTFDIFGRDKSASRTMNTIGANAAAAGKKVALAAAAIAAAVAVVVVRFGVDSVKAAADAETQQNKLTAAWAKFPKTANVSLAVLRDYNTELAKKTRFDDDAIASGQAVLAQFKLTGKQIKAVTPLLLDYAARTGKDLPTAARDFGKALLGQGRALKAIGINFKDTGSEAGNFKELIALVSAQVGGFAENEGNTAAGKLEILKNRFGEVQEAIGVALMPALSDLLDFTNSTLLPGLEQFASWFSQTGIPAIRDFAGWIVQYKDILGPAVLAVGGLTAAQWALNAAMDANPVGVIILALTAVIALVSAYSTNLGGFGDAINGWTLQVMKFFITTSKGIAGFVDGWVNGIVGALNFLLGPINAIRAALGMGAINLPTSNLAHAVQGAYGVLVAGAGTVYTGTTASTGHTGGHVAGQFASGGIVPARPGGWLAQVGEGGQDEAIIPLSKLGRMGGGDSFHFHIQTLIGDDNRAMQRLQRMAENTRRRGAISGSI